MRVEESIGVVQTTGTVRVLHVIDQLVGGGAETSLREIVLGTQGDGVQHAVVVLKPDERGFEGFRQAGIGAYVPPSVLRSRWSRLQWVRGAIAAFDPHVVHTSLAEASLAGRVAARLARKPALTSLVNIPHAVESRQEVAAWKRWIVRGVDVLLSRYATTHFHAVTQLVADAGVSTLGVDRSRVTVVHRGRDVARLGAPSADRRERTRQRLGVRSDTPLVVNVGREEPQKDQVALVHAFARVQRRLPDALLLIAGRPGNATHEISTALEALGIEPGVMRLGFRDDVPDLLCAADVFAFTSRYEGAAGAVLEAMALGVPVVSNDIPALREILEDGHLGLLAPASEPDQFAAAIVTALEDGPQSRARADRARQRFHDSYQLDSCLQGMRGLYLHLARP